MALVPPPPPPSYSLFFGPFLSARPRRVGHTTCGMVCCVLLCGHNKYTCWVSEQQSKNACLPLSPSLSPPAPPPFLPLPFECLAGQRRSSRTPFSITVTQRVLSALRDECGRLFRFPPPPVLAWSLMFQLGCCRTHVLSYARSTVCSPRQ